LTRRPAHRAGVVGILGPPNAGKSTLLNALLGEKLAIVTHRPQTTRSRILGIDSRPEAQILFQDTPGLHEGTRPLNEAINAAVAEAARDCDLALLLVDRRRGWTKAHAALQAQLVAAGTPWLLVGTKQDRLPAKADPRTWPPPEATGALDVCSVSALRGEGLEALREAIVARLPQSPPLHPADALTDRPLRWLAGELVREALFEELEQELPHASAVEVTAFEEPEQEGGVTRIEANVLVARSSQKRIVIGSGGAVIKRIGTRARREIEQLVGGRVHLELWVKIDPRWLANQRRIEELGYR